MSDFDISPKESDIQSAIIDIATKKITDLTNQTIILEANLLACQNNLRLQVSASKDVSSEFNQFKDNYAEKLENTESENSNLKKELKEVKEEFEDANKLAKVLSGKKTEVKTLNKQLSELKSRYDVVNQERADLMSKIESGYKVQIRELKEKLEAVNADNNITQEKSS